MEIKKIIKSESGAAGVLVIFMTLVTLTLGALALSNAKANLGFSEKALERNAMFYELDAEAQSFLLYTDKILADAGKSADNYVADKGYEQKSYDGIPAGLQRYITDMYNQKSASPDFVLNDFTPDVRAYIYLYIADNGIINNQESFFRQLLGEKNGRVSPDEWQTPEISVMPLSDGDVISDIKVEASFFGDNGADFNLSVKFDIYSGLAGDAAPPGGGYYEITEWRRQ